ncbi:MAG: hypothetical protein AAFN74_17515, partial [Myxococcota bacterium]
MKHVPPRIAASTWVIVWNKKSDEQTRVPPLFAADANGDSPFRCAIRAALAWAPATQVSPVVFRSDRPWWSKATASVPVPHLAEQPFDRGTAPGILLGLLRIARSNPDACIVLLCSERRPPSLSTVARALCCLDARTPLVSCTSGGRVVCIRSDDDWPNGIVRSGDVLVAPVHGLIQLFTATQPELTEGFIETLDGASLFDESALDRLYPFLPEVDFESEVLGAFYGHRS